MVHLHFVVHGVFIAFFAWLLLFHLFHVFHSKSSTSWWGPSLIEGLDATTVTTAPTQAQMDENPDDIAFLKGQIATLMQTAQTLQIQMVQNEAGIQANTKLIQQVVQSQIDTTNKLAALKSRQ
jgi:hypothetical protein